MQAIMLPALSLSFAVPAVAGQNVGAKRPDRVRETFRSAAIMSTVLMVALTLLCQLWPAWLVQVLRTIRRWSRSRLASCG